MNTTSYTVVVSRFSNGKEKKTHKEFSHIDEVKKYMWNYLKRHGYTLIDVTKTNDFNIITRDMEISFDVIEWNLCGGDMTYNSLNINDIF